MLHLAGPGIRLDVDPHDGGRITGLQAHDREWLVASGPRHTGGAFVGAGTGGWDEAVPTVAACRLPDGRELADHGDAWRTPWTVVTASADVVELRVELTSVEVTLVRRIAVTPEGVRLSWTATGTGRPIPLLWSAHPLFRAPPGAWLDVDVAGAVVETRLPRGATGVPTAIGAYAAGHVLKAFVPGVATGAVVHPDGARVRLTWDPTLLPHLGLYADRDVHTTTPVLALEPTTGRSDSAAVVRGELPVVGPGRPLSWWIDVEAG